MMAPMRRTSSTRRHGKRWQGSYYDATGKRRWVTADTLDELRRLLAELRVASRRSKHALEADPGRIAPVPRLVEEYLGDLQLRTSRSYARMTATRLRRMVEGVADLRQITPRLIQDRRAGLSGSNRTRNRHVEAVRSWLTWCEETGRIRVAPRIPLRALNVKGEHVARRRRVLSPAECEAVLGATATGHIALLTAIIMGTGLRLREALGLRWADVVDGAVHVRAAAAGNRKSRRPRTVPMPAWLADRVTEARKARGRLLGRLPLETDPVVISPRGLPLDNLGGPERCYRWLREAIARAGIPHRTAEGTLDWHALRHTYATTLGQTGATGPEIQALLGHSTLAQASQYVRADRIPTRPAVDRLPQLGAPDGAKAVPEQA